MQEMSETQVCSLGWEDSLEEGMATHSSILAWRMSCTEDPGELYSPKDHKEWDMTKVTERVHMYMCVCIPGTLPTTHGWAQDLCAEGKKHSAMTCKALGCFCGPSEHLGCCIVLDTVCRG